MQRASYVGLAILAFTAMTASYSWADEACPNSEKVFTAELEDPNRLEEDAPYVCATWLPGRPRPRPKDFTIITEPNEN